jgi:FtsH-binding integral membrane protein
VLHSESHVKESHACSQNIELDQDPQFGLKRLSAPLYKLKRNSVPNEPSSPGFRPRSGPTIIAAGLLLCALALVVLYTSRQAFHSLVALVVVAAIGVAALLLQLRMRPDLASDHSSFRSPLWLSALGVVCAVVAVFANFFQLSAAILTIAALIALLAFAAAGILIIKELRNRRV